MLTGEIGKMACKFLPDFCSVQPTWGKSYKDFPLRSILVSVFTTFEAGSLANAVARTVTFPSSAELGGSGRSGMALTRSLLFRPFKAAPGIYWFIVEYGRIGQYRKVWEVCSDKVSWYWR